MKTEQHLIYLEKLLMEPVVRKSTEQISNLLSDDFFEYGSSGLVWDKQTTIEFLMNESTPAFEAYDFQVRELSKEVYQVTYKTKWQNSFVLRSSIWKQVGSDWKMIFHQGTRSL